MAKIDEWLQPDKLILLEGWARDGLTDEQILDLTNKINDARASLKENKETDENNATDPNVTTAKQISEAINASALALNDFSDNPAWGNILKNVATLAANWDTL